MRGWFLCNMDTESKQVLGDVCDVTEGGKGAGVSPRSTQNQAATEKRRVLCQARGRQKAAWHRDTPQSCTPSTHFFPKPGNVSPLLSPSGITWALGDLDGQGGNGCFKKTGRQGDQEGGRQTLSVKLNTSEEAHPPSHSFNLE